MSRVFVFCGAYTLEAHTCGGYAAVFPLGIWLRGGYAEHNC